MCHRAWPAGNRIALEKLECDHALTLLTTDLLFNELQGKAIAFTNLTVALF